MTKLFNYRGYQGTVNYTPDEDDGYFSGMIKHPCHYLCFGGETLEEARRSFMDAVDEYIERGVLYPIDE